MEVHREPQWLRPMFRTEKYCHIINSLIYTGDFSACFKSAQVTGVKNIRSGGQKILEKLAVCFSFWSDVVSGEPPPSGICKTGLPTWSRCSMVVGRYGLWSCFFTNNYQSYKQWTRGKNFCDYVSLKSTTNLPCVCASKGRGVFFWL